ncbi:MAG: Response regulator containing a CheY-like receiver domain and a GGDEF domain [Idiomarinaceae bacterium HL-53]|nr:MAG: Response regulator containing a CheY-like receiver domain and a GGDEF domain [Idiomarinaceae bacterium HL-53]CUS48133.1 diguanylate cyclase (GGDEF) domain-containing protein [Idiomarinaceae bacterium HL-53]
MTRRWLVPFLLLWMSLFGASEAYGAQASETETPDAIKASHYFVDGSGGRTIGEVAGLPDYAWEAVPGPHPSFGYDLRTYWFKLTLTSAQSQRLLHVQYPLLDSLDIYFMREGRVLAHYPLGDRLPFNARRIPHEDFVVEVPDEESFDVYFRVQSESSITLPLALWEEADFHAAQGPRQLAFGLYFGVLICMVVYNLFGYAMTREPSFLSYSFYVVFIGLMMSALSGAGFRYIWPEMLWVQDRGIPLFGSMSFAFAALFIAQLLNVKNYSVTYHRGLWILGIVSLAIALASIVFPYALSIKLLLVFAVIACVFVIFLAFAMWRRGLVYARIFTLAWFAFLSAVVLNSLGYLEIIDAQFIQRYAIMAGSGLEVLLLSWVLTLRYSEERTQKMAAQEEALRQSADAQEAQRQLNEELEERVADRTFELEMALRELQEVNNELERKNSEDGLTGLYNRRHFDRQLTAEFRRAWRNKEPLALIMLDIDHFKPVNDTHGHMIGDQILVALATRLKKGVRRPGDTICRYGGEEFAIILANTDEQDATHVAANIGAIVRDSEFQTDAGPLSITVSMGVCVAKAGFFEVPEQLLKAADDALYEAKNRGRDQTVVARAQIETTEDGQTQAKED